MKKLVTLLAAAGMVVAASAPANAVDMKVDARWRASMSTGSTGFEGDNVSQARQRLRLGLTATASENLSGYFQFQIGKDRWGTTTNTHGAHSGDDGNNITLRQSYIDWTVPATAAKVRMGRFAIGLPADAVSSNAVFTGDWGNKEGVAVSAPVTDWLGLSAMWARVAANGTSVNESAFDDMFAVVADMKFDGVKAAVYAAYATLDGAYTTADASKHKKNKDTGEWEWVEATKDTAVFGVRKGAGNGTNFNVSEGEAYWVGFTSTFTMFDPFTVKLSAAYGAFDSKDNLTDDTEGWNVQAMASYKLGFGTPFVAAWYFSGMDEDNDGLMPSIGGYFTPTRSYHDAAKGLNGGTAYGLPSGNWGVQAGIEGVSFLSNLSHEFKVTYMQGTNDKDYDAASAWELTEDDSLVEFDLVNTYKIYKNLAAHLELSYIINDFNSDAKKDGFSEDDWRAELTFEYKF